MPEQRIVTWTGFRHKEIWKMGLRIPPRPLALANNSKPESGGQQRARNADTGSWRRFVSPCHSTINPRFEGDQP